MGKATGILTRKGIAKKKSPKYRKTDLAGAFCQEEVKYSVIDQVCAEDILMKTVKAAGISCVDKREERVEIKAALEDSILVKERAAGTSKVKVVRENEAMDAMLVDNIPLKVVRAAGISNRNVTEGDTAAQAVLAEEISVSRFERSIGRMSKELKQQYSQEKSLSSVGVWNAEGVNVKERLRPVSLADSILSPYQIKRK